MKDVEKFKRLTFSIQARYREQAGEDFEGATCRAHWNEYIWRLDAVVLDSEAKRASIDVTENVAVDAVN